MRNKTNSQTKTRALALAFLALGALFTGAELARPPAIITRQERTR